MIRIGVCASCWCWLEPMLLKRARDEAAFLRMIGRRLTRCQRCRPEGYKLQLRSARLETPADFREWLRS